MKWGEFDLNWVDPLKSILSVFDKRIITLNFIILIHQTLPSLIKILKIKKNFLKILNHMIKFLKQGIIIDHNKKK